MNKKFNEIIGWYGVVAILLAYVLVSFNFAKPDSSIYQILNLTGALGVAVISLMKKAYQPAVLNIVWSFIAAVALIMIFLQQLI
ncbi:MAG: hypothetical protein WCX77_02795 [Candidatus Paceibacterota bacterium]|jgi:hypothetical protein